MAEIMNRGLPWGPNETVALVEIWRDEDVEGQLEGVRRNMPVYNRIAELLLTRGYERTAKQCRSKLKALKHEYFKLKKNENKSGHGARPMPRVFEILDEILGTRPLANPVRIIDVLGDSGSLNDSGSQLDEDEAEGPNDADDDDTDFIENAEIDRPASDMTLASFGDNDENNNIKRPNKSPTPTGTGNDANPTKTRKRQASETNKMTGLLETFMAQQVEAREQMIRHEEQQRLAMIEAEREARREENEQQLQMMRMMMGFFANPATAANPGFGGSNMQGFHPAMPASHHSAPVMPPYCIGMSPLNSPPITTQHYHPIHRPHPMFPYRRSDNQQQIPSRSPSPLHPRPSASATAVHPNSDDRNVFSAISASYSLLDDEFS